MKIGKCFLPAAAAAALILIPHADGAQPAYQVQAVVGDVKIISGGSESPAAEGRTLGGGETIVTGKNSMADISWGDRGLVRVDEKTKISVALLSKKSEDPDLDLSAGSVMVMLSKLVRGESFQVKTSTQVASVRGTSFEVGANGDSSRVNVITGRIMIHPVHGGRILREIGEEVGEERSVAMNRQMVREIVAKKRKIAVTALRNADLDRLTGRIDAMRKSRGFNKLNSGVRNEINRRMERRIERRREGIDREKQRRDKKRHERGGRQRPGR